MTCDEDVLTRFAAEKTPAYAQAGVFSIWPRLYGGRLICESLCGLLGCDLQGQKDKLMTTRREIRRQLAMWLPSNLLI
jgi:hypothetical protein